MAARKSTLLMLPEVAIPFVDADIEVGALVLLELSAERVVVGARVTTVLAKLLETRRKARANKIAE